MHQILEKWLIEIQAEALSLPDNVNGGATENLWAISFLAEDTPDASELVSFVEQAVSARKVQAEHLHTSPATFYFWNDEQAGQLRFSVARCTPDSLPFGAVVSLASTPQEIIRSFLLSPYRNRIPWSDLEEVAIDAPQPSRSDPGLMVWAQRLS